MNGHDLAAAVVANHLVWLDGFAQELEYLNPTQAHVRAEQFHADVARPLQRLVRVAREARVSLERRSRGNALLPSGNDHPRQG